MANSSDDLSNSGGTGTFSVANKPVKFTLKSSSNEQQQQQQQTLVQQGGGGGGGGSSSAASSGDDDYIDNDNYESYHAAAENSPSLSYTNRKNMIGTSASNHASSSQLPTTGAKASSSTTYGGGGAGGGSGSGGTRKNKKKRAVWEVIEGYRDPTMRVQKPPNYEGILLKRRNWPMKGWHKRFFILADGILSYGKSKADMTKNKVHGTINAYLSIVSYIACSRRILIDSSTQSTAFVCHLKGRNQIEFDLWLESLKQHRLYYQYKYTQQYTATHQLTTTNNNNNNNTNSSSSNSASANNVIAGSGTANQPGTSQSVVNLSKTNSFAALTHHQANSFAAIQHMSSSKQQQQQQHQQQTGALMRSTANQQSNQQPQQQQLHKNQREGEQQTAGGAKGMKVAMAPLQHYQPIADEKTLDNHFKRVEENLMELSNVLGSLYLSSLSAATTSTNTLGTSQFVPHHQQRPSNFSVEYLHNPSSNVVKLSLSRSNPNLINNEIVQMPISIDVETASNNSSSDAKTDASSSSFTTPSSNNNNKNNKNNNLNADSNGPTAAQTTALLNSSNASLYYNTSNVVNSTAAAAAAASSANNNTNNDTSIFKFNFYQGAKSINDQLIFIYQQLLLKKQSLSKLPNYANSNEQQQQQNQQGQDGTPSHQSLSAMRVGGGGGNDQQERAASVNSSQSLQDSQLQFYDAIEYFTSDSESDDDSDQDSDGDVNETTSAAIKSAKLAIVPEYDDQNIWCDRNDEEEELQSQKILTRRRKLPAICPDASQVSIWGILRKAIGKDLSKISLPVILNEPLSILQRLCEEIEYSDLLDTASQLTDPYDRMVYMAAFVISGYSSSYYRNGAKDFNPLLGETYELMRPDKGWKYVAEQVSHHPPISSTHCQSKTFVHEQVFHAKIKFWGKSMEVHPEGYTRVTLPKFNETYQWNKIVMYVHNIMGASRKIEHYGEITIRCTNGTSCTITFPKSSYSSQKNEFYGDVICDNIVKRKIFGQWHESFLCGTDNTAKTIWRMGAMPEEANMYYGFTRFAIELNEFTENLRDELPPTDSRFRPDQRNLENGLVEKAELEKHRIEEMQRTRRKEMEARNDAHKPLWFQPEREATSISTAAEAADSNGSELNVTSTSSTTRHHHNHHHHHHGEKEWVFNNQYWLKREQNFNDFKQLFPKLW